MTEVFTGFGERGVRAETVAQKVVDAATSYLESGAAVGPYLADQLLLPMVLAGGGSFTTVAPTNHSVTNSAVIGKFLCVDIMMHKRSPGVWLVEVGVQDG